VLLHCVEQVDLGSGLVSWAHVSQGPTADYSATRAGPPTRQNADRLVHVAAAFEVPFFHEIFLEQSDCQPVKTVRVCVSRCFVPEAISLVARQLRVKNVNARIHEVRGTDRQCSVS